MKDEFAVSQRPDDGFSEESEKDVIGRVVVKDVPDTTMEKPLIFPGFVVGNSLGFARYTAMPNANASTPQAGICHRRWEETLLVNIIPLLVLRA